MNNNSTLQVESIEPVVRFSELMKDSTLHCLPYLIPFYETENFERIGSFVFCPGEGTCVGFSQIRIWTLAGIAIVKIPLLSVIDPGSNSTFLSFLESAANSGGIFVRKLFGKRLSKRRKQERSASDRS